MAQDPTIPSFLQAAGEHDADGPSGTSGGAGPDAPDPGSGIEDGAEGVGKKIKGRADFKGRYSLRFYSKKFEDYRSTMESPRAERLREQEYYHGDQLSSEEKAKLTERKQPIQIHNRMRAALNGMIGVIATSKTDPRALPRTPDSEASAEVVNECLRYAADKTDFDHKKVKAFKDYAIPGTCAILIGIDKDFNVDCQRIRYEEYFCDPRSREEDMSDKQYDGIGKWMYVTQLSKRYPAFKKAIEMAGDTNIGLEAVLDETFEDRPTNNSIWIDTKNKRLFVIEMYYKELGEWYRCVYFAGGILEEGSSPYKCDKKRSMNPIEGVSCYVDTQNVRYGMAKDMMTIQDGINKRHSKLLHLANTSQIQAVDPAAIEVDADTARMEAARPDGVIPFGWNKVSTTDMAASQTVLLAKDEAEIERLGPNPAILGRQGADSSGKALLTRQQAGMVELGLPIEQFDHWELRCYRQMWYRIKQFWTEPQFIRVMKDPTVVEEGVKFIHINKPQYGTRPALDEQTGNVVEEQYILGYENDIGEIDVDVMIDTQPETATLMAEIASQLMDLVSRVPAYQNQVPIEIFIELLPLPRKTRLLKKLAAEKDKNAKMQAAQQEHAAGLEEAQVTAKVNKTNSETDLINTTKPKVVAETQHILSETSKNALETFMMGEGEAGSTASRASVH